MSFTPNIPVDGDATTQWIEKSSRNSKERRQTSLKKKKPGSQVFQLENQASQDGGGGCQKLGIKNQQNPGNSRCPPKFNRSESDCLSDNESSLSDNALPPTGFAASLRFEQTNLDLRLRLVGCLGAPISVRELVMFRAWGRLEIKTREGPNRSAPPRD